LKEEGVKRMMRSTGIAKEMEWIDGKGSRGKQRKVEKN
jgi:hypothetical protein